MEQYSSQHVPRFYPTRLRFKNNRFSVNRSNLRVIEAKEETGQGNNIEVPCLPQKVKEDLLKNYSDDLDEISDSPLADDTDDFENISEGSLSAESDVEADASVTSSHSKIEVPVGYRSCSVKRLTGYKRLAFFKPKLYKLSQNRIVVGCVHIDDTNNKDTSVKTDDQADEPNLPANIKKNKVVTTSGVKVAEPLQGKTVIQEELDGSKDVIIGMEFLVEVWDEPGVSLRNYLCLSCDKELEKMEVLKHLIGISHRRTYLDKHFPKFTSMFYKNASLENSEEFPISSVCKAINDGESALPFITSSAYLTSHRHELEEKIDKMFYNKGPIALLLKELCLIVATKLEFNDDAVNFPCYGTTAPKNVDSRNSENNEVIILSDEKEQSDDGVEIIHVQTVEKKPPVINSDSDAAKLNEQAPKGNALKFNYHKQQYSDFQFRFGNSRKRAYRKGSAPSLKTSSSVMMSTSSSKSAANLVPALPLKAEVSTSSAGSITKDILSQSNSVCKSKSKHENKEKNSHCGKCKGLKKNFRTDLTGKRCTKQCNCKSDPPTAIGLEIKQKEDSSKANMFHESRSVTSSSNGEKKQVLEGSILSAKARDANYHSGKEHKKKMVKSKYKWQKGDRVIRDVEKSGDKMPGENTVVHSKNEKGPSVDQQPKNHEKSNDDPKHRTSNRRYSRSPKRSLRISPKKLSDRKSLVENRSNSHSIIRKDKTSPLRQNLRATGSPIRRRSRSPLRRFTSIRKRHLSPDRTRTVTRNRSRSPFRTSWRRSRSPLSLRKRSRSPPSVKRKRSRSPLISVRGSRHIPSPPRRDFALSSRDIRSRQLSPRRRIHTLVRHSFERSISPPNRRRKRSKSPSGFPRRHSRSPLKRRSISISSISSKEDSPFEKKFIASFQTVDNSFQENIQLPVPPVNSQAYPSVAYPAPWDVPNPAGNYNYNFSYPPTNPAYLPSTYPQFTDPSTHIPPYPNTAYPPPAAPPVPASHYIPPTSMSIPVSTGMPPQMAKLDINVPIQYPNPAVSGQPPEKMFNELQNVVTKLFGASVPRLPAEAKSRDFLNKGLSAHENIFGRNTHSDEIPFLGSAGTSSTSPSKKLSEDQERMYIQMLQQLRKEFGSSSIPDDLFKFAVKGMFPEQLLSDGVFDIINQKSLEQGQSLDKSSKLPDMNAKVEFKESSYAPKQGNIFPIVRQNALFQNQSFTNPTSGGGGNGSNFHKQRNANDVDFRVKTNFPNKASRQGNISNAQPEKKTLAQRLASVLVKLEMFDVPGQLLSEMLHKIGVFNRALPLQDITEEEIISVLREHGYLRGK